MKKQKYSGSNGDYGIYSGSIKTIPSDFNPNHRYSLEMRTDLKSKINSKNHLVVICMNPSTASDKITDPTVNEIIRTMFIMGYKGFTLFNLYPERATEPKGLPNYTKVSDDEKKDIDTYLEKNIECLKTFLEYNPDITEVWGAWGDLDKKVLTLGEKEVLKLLKSKVIKVFYFVKKTKQGNPPHPLNRKIAKFRQPRNKKYL